MNRNITVYTGRECMRMFDNIFCKEDIEILLKHESNSYMLNILNIILITENSNIKDLLYKRYGN